MSKNVYARVGIEGDVEAEQKLLALDAKAKSETTKLETTVNSSVVEAARRADASGASLKNQLEADVDAALADAGVDTTQFVAQSQMLIQGVAAMSKQVKLTSDQELELIRQGIAARNAELAALKTNSHMTFGQTVSMVHHGYMLFSNLLSGFSQVLGIAGSALVSFVFQTATTFYALATSEASNPTTAAMALFTFATASATFQNAINTEAKQRQLEQKVKTAETSIKRQASSTLVMT